MSSEATSHDEQCNPGQHDWIPWGFKVYSTDRYGNPKFLRTEDVRCLWCGAVKQVRGSRGDSDV